MSKTGFVIKISEIDQVQRAWPDLYDHLVSKSLPSWTRIWNNINFFNDTQIRSIENKNYILFLYV